MSNEIKPSKSPLRQNVRRRSPLRRGEWFLLLAPGLLLLLFFGWRMWQAQGRARLGIIGEHRNMIGALAFAPDGTLASGAGGGYEERSVPAEVKLWDASGDVAQRTLSGPDRSVSALAFTRDGQRLAVGSISTVAVWKRDSSHPLWTVKGHGHSVSSVSFSPDGTLLASSGSDGMIKVWDAATGNPVWARGPLWPDSGPDQETHVAFAPDGQTLASVGSDGLLKVWHARSGVLRRSLRLGRKKPNQHVAVLFSSDGATLLTSTGGGLTLWNARSWRPRRKIVENAHAAAFSPDSALIATMGSGPSGYIVKLWDARLSSGPGKPLRAFAPLGPERVGGPFSNHYTRGYLSSSAVAFSPDGQRLAYIDKRSVRSIRLRDISELRARRRVRPAAK